MVNAWGITKYDRTASELEEFLLFSVAVAGHNADSTARALDKFLAYIRERTFKHRTRETSPFGLIRLADMSAPFMGGSEASPTLLERALRDAGIGCYRARAKAFLALAWSKSLDLKSCTVEDLEKFPGIGPKTSRFFLLHSREGFVGAALDTHILKFLRDQGVRDVPKSTPSSGATYRRLETEFLSRVPKGVSVADFDLNVWKQYAGRTK